MTRKELIRTLSAVAVLVLAVAGFVEVVRQRVPVSPPPTAGQSPALSRPAVSRQPVVGERRDEVLVERTIDGDTVVLSDGRIVRYIGVDAPETKHPRSPVECFGTEAAAANRTLVEGKSVRLERDVSETDRYGRLLRYVWVGGALVNERLVREGYATVVSIPPDVKRQDLLRTAQSAARRERRGLWGEACER